MVTIPVYSIKGGVGKTATAVNLAFLSAESGLKTLVWDLDPQGATTFYLKLDPKLKGGVSALLSKDHLLSEYIVKTEQESLYAIPSDFSLRNIDHYLDEGRAKTRKIRHLIQSLEGFDLLFIDCPPGITLLSENILEAADMVLSPLIPTVLSERTHDELLAFCQSAGISCRILPFFSMVDKRKRMHLEYLMELDKRKTPFLKHFIPYSSIVEQMGRFQQPVIHYARSSFAAKCYEDLWKSVRRQIRI